MQLIPAIDLLDGRCVRLYKGDFTRETRYDVGPLELASHYRDLGASRLHVVDLDGAKRGTPVNLDLVAHLRAETGLHVQLGGGIRDRASLKQALAAVDRVVIGSLAVTAADVVAGWIGEFGGDRIALALDVRIGADGTALVSTHGWTQASALSLAAAIERFQPAGLRHVLCTDIDRDGALAGPNLSLYRDCAARWPGVAFIASGGVRDVADLTALAATGVAGAVSGKALLEGRFSEEELRPFLLGA